MSFYFLILLFRKWKKEIYTYANKEITLTFTIIEGGFKITDINLTNNSTKKIVTGTGEMMKYSMNVWYQFQTKDCDFEFDVPENKMILSQFCGKAKSKKYELVKKQ